jgi:hypothetical protein
MGPPSHMRSIIDRNVVMRQITVHGDEWLPSRPSHFALEEKQLVPASQDTRGAPELIWTIYRQEQFLALLEHKP